MEKTNTNVPFFFFFNIYQSQGSMTVRAVHDERTCSIQKWPAHTDAAPSEYSQGIVLVAASMSQKLREPWHWRPFTVTKHFGYVHLWPWTQLRVEAYVNQQTLPNYCMKTRLTVHNSSSRCWDVFRHIKSNFPTGWLRVLSSQATHHHSFDSCGGSQSRLLYLSYSSKQRECVCTSIKSTSQPQKYKNKHKEGIFTAEFKD